MSTHTGASPLAPWHVTPMGLCCRGFLCNIKQSIAALHHIQPQLRLRLTCIGPLAQQPPSPASQSGMSRSDMTGVWAGSPLLDAQATSCLHVTLKLSAGSPLSFWGSARLQAVGVDRQPQRS